VITGICDIGLKYIDIGIFIQGKAHILYWTFVQYSNIDIFLTKMALLRCKLQHVYVFFLDFLAIWSFCYQSINCLKYWYIRGSRKWIFGISGNMKFREIYIEFRGISQLGGGQWVQLVRSFAKCLTKFDFMGQNFVHFISWNFAKEIQIFLPNAIYKNLCKSLAKFCIYTILWPPYICKYRDICLVQYQNNLWYHAF